MEPHKTALPSVLELMLKAKRDFEGDEWIQEFETQYFDNFGRAIVFHVETDYDHVFSDKKYVYVEGSTEFNSRRMKLFGIDDGSGLTVKHARMLVRMLTDYSKKGIVPKDLDDWPDHPYRLAE